MIQVVLNYLLRKRVLSDYLLSIPCNTIICQYMKQTAKERKERFEKLEKIWRKAVLFSEWHSLIGYPELLFRWQAHNHLDVKPIAQFTSHKLGRHEWCTTPIICKELEDLLLSHLPNRMNVGGEYA